MAMPTQKSEISADIFRAYDIRGIYNDDLYPETMLKIGLGLGTYVKERSETSVVVGNDIRTTSPFSGWLLKKDIIAYVTASHLPPEWNGVKFYSGAGIGFSAAENGKIRDMSEDGWVLIRASNTSPLIRVTVEGATDAIQDELMRKFVGIVEDAIRQF